MLRRKDNDSNSDLNNEPSLREVRVEQRRNYTDACVEEGGDAEGIARGTNQVYRSLWGDKPSGSRDHWSEEQQKEIAVAENLAANHIRGNCRGDSQADTNDNIVQQSAEGAEQARAYIDDQQENGNWWSRLF